MFKLFPTLVLAFVPVIATAEDDTLRFYLSKSDAVLVAESLDDTSGQFMLSEAALILDHGYTFKVVQSIKGNAKAGQTFDWGVLNSQTHR